MEDLSAPTLQERDEHHLGAVRRLEEGEKVLASNGAGSSRLCVVRLDASSKKRRRPLLSLEAEGAIVFEERPRPPVTVAFSFAKGERTAWAVQKLAEAGADEIVPLLLDRTVVRPDSAQRRERLQLVADEAAMQARRSYRLQVREPLRLEELLSSSPSGELSLCETGGGPPSIDAPVALVGPEGGFSPQELEAARRAGARSVRLGPHVMRVETAAVAAGVLLTALRDDIVLARD